MSREILITIAGAALLTYLTRFPIFLLSEKIKIPAWASRYLSFIAPSVLTALIVPSILVKDRQLDISLFNEYIPAAFVTLLVAYFSKNMLASVLSGVGTVALLVYVF